MQSLDIVSVLPDIQSASGHLALGLQLRGTAGERTRCGRGCATCMSPATRCLALQNVVLAPRRPDLDGLVLASTGDAGAIRMKAHRVDATVVVDEGVDALA